MNRIHHKEKCLNFNSVCLINGNAQCNLNKKIKYEQYTYIIYINFLDYIMEERKVTKRKLGNSWIVPAFNFTESRSYPATRPIFYSFMAIR